MSAAPEAELTQSRRYLTRLAADDSHEFLAYVSEPWGPPVGGLVVVHEITGLNHYVRVTADRWASEGYRVVAPSLFDRIQSGHATDYSAAELERSRAVAYRLDRDRAVGDLASAMRSAEMADIRAAVQAAGPGRVGVVGYCFGGSMAWLAATRIDPPPAVCVSYYGRWVAEYAEEKPRCPVMLHYGEWDPFIPIDDVRRVQRAHGDLPIFTYRAGHGFSCSDREDWFDPEADKLAWRRSADFVRRHLVEGPAT